MYIAQNIFEEIHKFLIIDLITENLSSACRCKLSNLIKKLETLTFKKNELKQYIDIYDDSHIYEEPSKISKENHDFNFELPKKLVKCRNDHKTMTLSGSLYYRYNLQCWELYPYSVLVDGRLICCKSGPSNNFISNNCQIPNDSYSPNSGKNSELSIFLMGYTAVMTWKDCGMNFVFKLTHPIEDTKVFAAFTEEEAFAWIEQINRYSVGATPSDVKIFREQPNFNLDPSDEFDLITDLSIGIENISLDDSIKIIHDNSHLRRQPSDVLNSINNSTVTNPNFIISEAKFNRSRSSYSFKSANNNTPVTGLQNNLGIIGPVVSGAGVSAGPLSGSGGGTSIISSVRRKVESIGNKYRNRKSFAGFSSKSFNITNNGISSSSVSTSKAKTMPPVSPDDNRRLSAFSVQWMPTSKDIIYSGTAKLRLQSNRIGWMERWCQLKPKLLECYHLQPNNSIMKPALDFALCLEDLTLGLSNDKKHRSALRLSCDNVKQDLLFEVLDKLLLGDWIKAFIEALGISNQKPISVYDISPPPPDPKSIENIRENIMHRSLTTIQSSGSETIYDEVCTSEIETPLTPITNIHHRKSVPLPDMLNEKLLSQSNSLTQPPSAPYAGRRCLREHPLPSLPASSPDSENNSDNMADTPTGNKYAEIDSVYDYSSTFGRTLDHSRTSTLKVKSEDQPYPTFNTQLRSDSLTYAESRPHNDYQCNSLRETKSDISPAKFSDNKQHWRVQGCSLADLIARLEPNSETQDHSSATVSSKTDSSCTPTYQYSSEDNVNSISNSFLSIQSVDKNSIDPTNRVCRSVSVDTDLSCSGYTHVNTNRNARPKSLLMKKTSLELVLEELTVVKEELKKLKKQKTDLIKAQGHKSFSKPVRSNDNVNSLLIGISDQIKAKEARLRELSSHSRKRFTIEIVTNLSRQCSS